MIILGNLLGAVATVLSSLLSVVLILVIARVIVSWVNADPHNTLVRIIVNSTEPMLKPIRERMAMTAGGLDFSPIILMLAVGFLQYFLIGVLRDYSLAIRIQAIGLPATGL